MLPTEKETHEVRRCDRLDLGAQPGQRVAMNTREQRAIAPLQIRGVGGKASAENDAVRLEQQERGVYLCARDTE